MTPNEAKFYRIRYTIAEAIFSVASWTKPKNYEFEAVRAMAHRVIYAISNGTGDLQ